MEFTLEVNWLLILGSAIIAQVLGFIWYSEGLFGKAWMKELKFSSSELELKPSTLALVFIGSILSALVLANFVIFLQAKDFGQGLFIGFLLSIPVFFAMMTQFLFSKKSWKLLFIDALYPAFWLIISGGLFASMIK
ncbi:MAG: DUF1761 domain-containing protein [Candidatus Dojkabacteria bacterium]|uniref:DUF1761 domain-containing protein n=2 Tax=Candidatus Dojkabacteria TaxID=74243 RepID=A0A136KJZ6_9BACT|nr:MAG: hypothetical protein UZ20_WS6002000333 [candidate division WS6 bacterium OLB21]MBW7953744.1 DUF1761 domain-containing protein [Candidatus Dojkabacteria bacterium]WKZ27456.1 MAG: DUF1761 domain-containing protein [Candidatus Dojkabacteria bacterium]